MTWFRCSSGQAPNLGTKSINTNGTYNASSDDLDGYSSVTVGVQPNVGTKSITSNGTYSASSDNLDGYSSVTVNVPMIPSYMAINEQTLTETSETLVVPYDTTRDIMAIVCYDLAKDVGSKSATCQLVRINYTSNSWVRSSGYTNGSSPPADTGTNQFGSVTIEDGTITFALRDSTYHFKSGRTYRTVIIYAET